MTIAAIVGLYGCVAVLAWYKVRDHYRLATLENYAREWGTPLGKRGACKGGPATIRRIK